MTKHYTTTKGCRFRAIASSMAVAWSLAGCASAVDGLTGRSDRTAEEVALLESTDEIVTRSMLQGAGIGAAVGCGLALAIGRDVESCLYGMLGGAALGAGAGYAVGSSNVAAAQAEYNEQAMIAELEQQETELRELEDRLHLVLTDQRQRLKTMNIQLAAHEISESDYRRQYDSMMQVRGKVAATLEAEKETREQVAAQVSILSKHGLDTTPVAVRNAANLQKIEHLIGLANQVEPSAL